MKWLDWLFARESARGKSTSATEEPLDLAQESLRQLLGDERLPASVRKSLQSDYQQVNAMLDRLEQGHLHIAAFGRVSTGKSSLLNTLAGQQVFATSPLHGETRQSAMTEIEEVEAGGVFLIDTPGLDEAFDEGRAAHAKEVTARADLVLFVVDADLTAGEDSALKVLLASGRPVLLVLNKRDRYTDAEFEQLLLRLREHTAEFLEPVYVIGAAADPRPETIIQRSADGEEERFERARLPDIEELREMLWMIVERDGKTLAAMNATLFAADLSDKVGQRILSARQEVAERVIRTYCYGKGLAVAINPVPVADLFAAAFVDAGMIVHLSKIYDLPLTRNEAGKLVRVIATEAAALMGTVWAIHFVSSALKIGTAGLSTLLTAGAQGAVAYYSTYVVGEVARNYLAAGKSWGSHGPKQVIRDILDSLDRDSILRQARDDIRARLDERGDPA